MRNLNFEEETKMKERITPRRSQRQHKPPNRFSNSMIVIKTLSITV